MYTPKTNDVHPLKFHMNTFGFAIILADEDQN